MNRRERILQPYISAGTSIMHLNYDIVEMKRQKLIIHHKIAFINETHNVFT